MRVSEYFASDGRDDDTFPLGTEFVRDNGEILILVGFPGGNRVGFISRNGFVQKGETAIHDLTSPVPWGLIKKLIPFLRSPASVEPRRVPFWSRFRILGQEWLLCRQHDDRIGMVCLSNSSAYWNKTISRPGATSLVVEDLWKLGVQDDNEIILHE